MIASLQPGNYSRDKRKDPVPRPASQVVWRASRRIKCFGEVDASPKTFLRRAEKHKLMNSLPLSQVFVCNEIVAVILINDLSYEVSGGLGVPRAVSKDKQTRDGTDFTLKMLEMWFSTKRNKWRMFAAQTVWDSAGVGWLSALSSHNYLIWMWIGCSLVTTSEAAKSGAPLGERSVFSSWTRKGKWASFTGGTFSSNFCRVCQSRSFWPTQSPLPPKKHTVINSKSSWAGTNWPFRLCFLTGIWQDWCMTKLCCHFLQFSPTRALRHSEWHFWRLGAKSG